MANKPWEEKIIDDKSANKVKRNTISTSWITGILSVFFIIVVGILFVVFYTSNSGEDKASETAGFFGASSAKVSTSAKSSTSTVETSVESSTEVETEKSSSKASKSTKSSKANKSSKSKKTSKSSKESQSSSSTSSSSQEANGETIVVQAGEGAGAIAARAGISVERLQELNPDHMTQGYWYANPGDAVIVN